MEREVRIAEDDVLAYRPHKQKGLLKDYPKLAAKRAIVHAIQW